MLRWQRVIGEFEPLTVIVGDWKAEFAFWEDGHRGGFYAEEDPDSIPVLHVTVYRRDNKEWAQVEGASWATRFPVDTAPSILLGHALEIIITVRVYDGELKLIHKYNHWLIPEEPGPEKSGPKAGPRRKCSNKN